MKTISDGFQSNKMECYNQCSIITSSSSNLSTQVMNQTLQKNAQPHTNGSLFPLTKETVSPYESKNSLVDEIQFQSLEKQQHSDNQTNNMMNGDKSNENTLRKRFTEEEDMKLKHLVQDLRVRNWDEVSKHMVGRTARQCRDRYNNYLFKDIRNTPWTEAEDRTIIEKYQIYGTHWVRISKFLEGRSGNNVKNRWYKYLSKVLGQHNLNYGNNYYYSCQPIRNFTHWVNIAPTYPICKQNVAGTEKVKESEQEVNSFNINLLANSFEDDLTETSSKIYADYNHFF